MLFSRVCAIDIDMRFSRPQELKNPDKLLSILHISTNLGICSSIMRFMTPF